MDARKGGVGVFQRARAKALQYVRYSPNLGANVILAGAAPKAAFDRFSANFPAMQAEIRAAEAARRVARRPRRAASAPRSMFTNPQDPSHGKGQLVIVTDLQATNWRDVTRGDLPDDVEILIEYVGLGPDVGNLAITNVATVSRPEVGRADAGARRDAELLRRGPVAHDRADRQRPRLPAGGRVQGVEPRRRDVRAARRLGRRGGLDHRRRATGRGARRAARRRRAPLRVQVRKAAVFALVSRESAQEVGTSAYFLARMLCPSSGTASAAGERVAAFQPGAATPDALAEADLLVLDKPGRLSRSGSSSWPG